MAEIKHRFTAGKMNKDLDERLVPNGEYRDAMNIQVRTTDGDAGGTVQNLQGNKSFAQVHNATNSSGKVTKCVGAVSDEKSDKAYFLFASPEITYNFISSGTELYIDSIVEQNSNTSYTNVVTDFWGAKIPASGITVPSSPASGYVSIAVDDQSLFRVGSVIRAINSSGVNKLAEGTTVAALGSDGNSIFLNKENTGDLASTNIIVTNPKVLGLDYNSLVTGINIVDDFLFYTTNTSEPKKINIRRCKKGTVSNTAHTKLYVDTINGLKLISDFESNNDGYLREEHVAVIKKAPKTAPEIELFKAQREGDVEWLTSYSGFVISANTPHPVGSSGQLPSELPDNVNFIDGDVLVFTSQNGVGTAVVRVRMFSNIIGADAGIYDEVFYTILSISDNITSSHTEWLVTLEQPTKNIFELKFPRFAYRYKYNDNEYSSFSPWSEVAFIPGDFKYDPSDGYNLGMTNLVKQINIKGFIEDQRVRPDEVKAIDILYKSSDSPTVYVVKTIERDVDPEWEVNTFYGSSGKVVLTTEMIHNMLPSNQTLRTWDNVPRYAKAQEVVGNRLTFANYTQGYDIPFKPNLRQVIKSSDVDQVGKPEKSIKSLRSYKTGVVFGDEYGRETPVISTGTKINENDSISYSYGSDDSILSKSFSGKSNKLSIAQDWTSQETSFSPPDWMSYFKYYIKETSNEYYNLAMDRWYDGQDKSVWLSFNSADRNKVDEGTYLILKNGHGNNNPIISEARYKILAIENEAPDFIKTTYKLLTNASGDTNGIFVPGDYLTLTSNQPQELMYESEFNLGSNNIDTAEVKGKLRVRLKATIDSDTAVFIITKWVDIGNITVNTDGDTILTVSELFGNQADIYNIAVDLGYYVDINAAVNGLEGSIKLEIAEFTVDNKPEFDGKFFVKISRDETLTEGILGSSVDNFLVDKKYDFHYINTVSPNPATTGEYKDYVWSGFNFFEASTLNTFSSSGGAAVNTWNYWDAFQSQDSSTLENIFFDDAEMYYAAQVPVGFSEATFEPKGFEAISTESQLSGLPLGTDGSITRLYISTTDVNALTGSYDFDEMTSTTEYSTKPWFSSFMESFEQGTMFRFAGDPNRTVYKVDYQYSGQYRVKNADGFYSDFLASQPSMFRMGFVINIQRISNSGQLTGSGIDVNDWDPRGAVKHDGTSSLNIEILDTFDGTLLETDSKVISSSAMWETEPREDLDLDLYYEASSGIPMKLDPESTVYFAPVGSKYSATRNGETVTYSNYPVVDQVHDGVILMKDNTNAVVKTDVHVGDIAEFTRGDGSVVRSKILDHISTNVNGTGIKPSTRGTFTGTFTADQAVITTSDTTGITNGMLITGGSVPFGSYVTNVTTNTNVTLSKNIPGTTGSGTTNALSYTDVTGYYSLDKDVYKYSIDLPWFNCWSFGNGVESDRIRDDYNANTLDNGVKVSSVFLDYQEENRKNSIIYSGLYNGDSNVNDLNQFIMAEKITKDLNPLYGSIQALKTRDTDLVTFTQDKVLRILANKDAVYNADGNPRLIATDRVLGQAVPFAGDYGISNNPESLACDQYRMYFTDKQRGAVLRLSRDGLTPISNVGMKTWFRDNLRDSDKVIGTFDTVNGEYNVSIKFKPESQKTDTTVSFNEASKGWVSFKSFVAQAGTSVSGKYYTSTGNKVWEHYRDDIDRGKFYNVSTPATISVLFNDIPGSVKNFNTINYEGTVGKSGIVNNQSVTDVLGNTVVASDSLYVSNSTGWSVESIDTDLDTGLVNDFHSKENKWFGNIVGAQKSDNDIFAYDLSEGDFAIQGIGKPSTVDVDSNWSQSQVEIIIQGG